MGFISIFVFLLSLETLILFALTLPLLLLSFFFSPLVAFAQNSTLQGVCACGTQVTHHILKIIPPQKGFSSSKALFGNYLFCKVLMKQARGVKQIFLFYFFSNLVCFCVFLNPQKFINLNFLKITLGYSNQVALFCLWDLYFLE